MIALLGLVMVAGAANAQDVAPDEARVNLAIERGLKFLRDQQQPQTGAWFYQFNHDHTLGMTALAGLAMLENNIPADDPAVTRARRVVVELADDSDQTYDLSLAILFLARLQNGTRGEHDDQIRRLAERLAGGERDGTWTYNVPMDQAAGSGRRGLPRSRIFRIDGDGDNSNTQFALLGIWAASRHGFDANKPLAAIDRHFRETQQGGGGWGYRPGQGGSDAMTCAGLMGLAIAAARPELAERQTARARGAALAADPAFERALSRVSSDTRRLGAGSDIYGIWSLERVGVALGLREFDGLDWYAAAATELLRRQRDDGSWPEAEWGTLPNTALALLVLRKANLAFELDRVLKLPGPTRAEPTRPIAGAAAPPGPAGPPVENESAGDDGITVVVRQADESKFPEVTIDFEVRRPDGSAVPDARREDFRVTEYDRDVPIASFRSPQSTEIRPTTIVLVLDRSRSMEEEDRIGALKRAVDSFLEVMPKGSRVEVVAFGSDVATICPFTDDPEQVRAAVAKLVPEGGTRYYDAVADALGRLAREPGRRAVLALTDGEDTFSRTATLDSVIAGARAAGLPVHTLGLGSEDEIESDALKQLAAATRGRYLAARDADQLRGIFEELALNLGQSYSLSYRTDRTLPDGTLRPVRVYYKAAKAAGEAAVYIRGMVVPAAGWPRLFVGLVAGLTILAILPGLVRRRAAA